MEIVIASSNTQKVLQIRQILKELAPKVYVLSLFDFPNYALPLHDPTKNIVENAQNKAENASFALQKCCIAEEWELIIPSLTGTSCKLSNEEGQDGEKGCEKSSLETSMNCLFTKGEKKRQQITNILNALMGKSEHERSAYIECCVACSMPDGKARIATARQEGYIAESERGKGGNDFDSIFIKYDYMKTLAELSPSVALRISHRRKALEKLTSFFLEGK